MRTFGFMLLGLALAGPAAAGPVGVAGKPVSNNGDVGILTRGLPDASADLVAMLLTGTDVILPDAAGWGPDVASSEAQPGWADDVLESDLPDAFLVSSMLIEADRKGAYGARYGELDGTSGNLGALISAAMRRNAGGGHSSSGEPNQLTVSSAGPLQGNAQGTVTPESGTEIVTAIPSMSTLVSDQGAIVPPPGLLIATAVGGNALNSHHFNSEPEPTVVSAPEPSTMMLLGTGASLLIAARRRRRQLSR